MRIYHALRPSTARAPASSGVGHSRIVLSWLPLASASPPSAHTDNTSLVCPRVRVHWPVVVLHSRTVLSTLPLASASPPSAHTEYTPLVCPVRLRVHSPVVVLHSRIVLSSLPLASASP